MIQSQSRFNDSVFNETETEDYRSINRRQRRQGRKPDSYCNRRVGVDALTASSFKLILLSHLCRYIQQNRQRPGLKRKEREKYRTWRQRIGYNTFLISGSLLACTRTGNLQLETLRTWSQDRSDVAVSAYSGWRLVLTTGVLVCPIYTYISRVKSKISCIFSTKCTLK